jgi:cephalosporin hydroxylase
LNQLESFKKQVDTNVAGIGNDAHFSELSHSWLCEAIKHNYAQNFTWMGRPIIQVPQDIYAIQELIWTVRPDLIIETGIAHGGSLILSASMLALLDYCDAVTEGRVLDPRKSNRRVVGIDIDIRSHNREAIEAHPLSHLIEMIQGSSVDENIVTQVKEKAEGRNTVLIFLDSNHTHEHVLSELQAYAPLVTRGSYCVVWDTGVEDLPDGFVKDRPWGKGNNPKTAVFEFLKNIKDSHYVGAESSALNFEIDKSIEHKITITAAPDGFLKRVGPY